MNFINTLTLNGQTFTVQDPNAVRAQQLEDVVRYDEQTMTDEQKAQARANIGAASDACFDQIVSNNRLDETAVVSGYLTNAGSLLTDGNYINFYVTDYIPVTPGEIITYQGLFYGIRRLCDMRTVAAYDENKTVVSSACSSSTVTKYTVPDGIYFIRVTSNSAYWTQYTEKAIVASADVVPYEEYGSTFMLKNKCLDMDDITDQVKDKMTDSSRRLLALPPKLYAFASQPVVTFLRNILPYNPDDVYVRMTTSNKGKLYGDRWEYTPTTAETVSVRYVVCDHDYNELNNDTFSLVVKDTTTKESLTVLVIGDSTVNAGTQTQKMLDLATADGYSLTLLGTRGAAPNLHEGRGGWTAEMYCNNASNTSGSVVNAFYNPDTSAFDFSYYMTQQGYTGVDCVFIQLGINDLFSFKTDAELAAGIETYLSNMEAMVNSIHTYDANIKIVLNMIIPCAADQDSFTSTYGMTQTTWRCRKNTYDGNMALMDKFKNTSNVYISHFNAALDTVNNMDGGVHPVAAGYEQLGTQMYSYMRAIN